MILQSLIKFGELEKSSVNLDEPWKLQIEKPFKKSKKKGEHWSAPLKWTVSLNHFTT